MLALAKIAPHPFDLFVIEGIACDIDKLLLPLQN